MYTKQNGTLEFVAPERINDQLYYTDKVDMWSIGIIIYMMLVGNHPFDFNGSSAILYS
jgi:serine/threonine protein kinase